MDYADIATAVFSSPNVGTVGLTEEQARSRYGAIDIYREAFRPLKHTLTLAGDRTMMKLVVDRASDRVVGCHMVGPDAAEIVQGLGHRPQMRRDQGAIRRHRRNPPHRGGRIRHHADPRRRARGAGGGIGGTDRGRVSQLRSR